jgi:hypothetical protein
VIAVETLDRLPAGWIVLDVYPREAHARDWTALVVNIHPRDCPPGALRQGWLPVPGKHRNRDAAWDALEDAIATRH